MKEYRTFAIAVFGIACLTYAATRGAVHGEDLQAVKWGIVGIVATVAGRSVGRAAAGGGGLKGIAAAIATEAKPDPSPATPGAAP